MKVIYFLDRVIKPILLMIHDIHIVVITNPRVIAAKHE